MSVDVTGEQSQDRTGTDDDTAATAGGPLVPPPVSQARPPRASYGVVPRPRLLQRLTRSVEQAPLTLICAPAGSGKTVLASDWARRRRDDQAPVAWLTMTDRDNHAGVFWGHLQLALAMVGALAAESLRPLFPDAADVDDLAARLLAISAPVIVVVGAAERLRARPVLGHLQRLIDAAGDRLRLVMITRVEPPLSIHRYRVENRVADIRADDLALDRDEVEQVLVQHGLSGTKELSDRVLQRTEGWAAGVRLAARRLESDGPDVELDGFAAPYIREEILAGMTHLQQHVLSTTSVADELPPGLAPVLSGHPEADELVRRLASGNALLNPVRGRPGVFRLHPLIRELLRADLEVVAPGRTAALHRRAAEWFEQRDQLLPAVRHAAAAGDWERAAERVVAGPAFAEVVAGTPGGVALAAHLAAIPEHDSPDVALLRAAIALREDDLQGARARLARAGDTADDGRRGLAASLVRTVWHEAAGEPREALDAVREARSRLDRLDTPDSLTRAAVATEEGALQLRAGDLAAACAALDEAVSASTDGDGPLRTRCLAELSLAEAGAGRLTRALELAEVAERSAEARAVPRAGRPAAIELARAWVAVERQELVHAQRSLDRVSRTEGARDDVTWRTINLLLRARILRDRGDLRGARRQLMQAGQVTGWLHRHLESESRAVGADRPASEPPAGQPRATSPAEPSDRHLEDLLARADRRCRTGDVGAAKVDIGHALQLGRTERLRRPFAHASPRVWSLIRSDARLHSKAGWLGLDQLDGGATSTGLAKEPLLEPLSERELEVLQHLAAFLTTEEIAAAMFISVNTVRTHVRRVLEKLAVSRRNEAVRRGQELGLV